MEVEILFHTSSSPKRIKNVVAVYTKGGLLCVQRNDRIIIKYPLCNVFQIAHKHGAHVGSSVEESEM
jgi:hypothetical protein